MEMESHSTPEADLAQALPGSISTESELTVGSTCVISQPSAGQDQSPTQECCTEITAQKKVYSSSLVVAGAAASTLMGSSKNKDRKKGQTKAGLRTVEEDETDRLVEAHFHQLTSYPAAPLQRRFKALKDAVALDTSTKNAFHTRRPLNVIIQWRTFQLLMVSMALWYASYGILAAVHARRPVCNSEFYRFTALKYRGPGSLPEESGAGVSGVHLLRNGCKAHFGQPLNITAAGRSVELRFAQPTAMDGWSVVTPLGEDSAHDAVSFKLEGAVTPGRDGGDGEQWELCGATHWALSSAGRRWFFAEERREMPSGRGAAAEMDMRAGAAWVADAAATLALALAWLLAALCGHLRHAGAGVGCFGAGHVAAFVLYVAATCEVTWRGQPAVVPAATAGSHLLVALASLRAQSLLYKAVAGAGALVLAARVLVALGLVPRSGDLPRGHRVRELLLLDPPLAACIALLAGAAAAAVQRRFQRAALQDAAEDSAPLEAAWADAVAAHPAEPAAIAALADALNNRSPAPPRQLNPLRAGRRRRSLLGADAFLEGARSRGAGPPGLARGAGGPRGMSGRMLAAAAKSSRRLLGSARQLVARGSVRRGELGAGCGSLDKLFAQGAAVAPLLRGKAQEWAQRSRGWFRAKEAELSLFAFMSRARAPQRGPSSASMAADTGRGKEGARFMLWGEASQHALLRQSVAWPALKTPGRAMEKALQVYDGDVSRLTDIARQAIYFESLRDIRACLTAVAEDHEVEVASVRSRLGFSRDAAGLGGFRNLVVKLRVRTAAAHMMAADEHVCELQLLLKSFAQLHSPDAHARYLTLRKAYAQLPRFHLPVLRLLRCGTSPPPPSAEQSPLRSPLPRAPPSRPPPNSVAPDPAPSSTPHFPSPSAASPHLPSSSSAPAPAPVRIHPAPASIPIQPPPSSTDVALLPQPPRRSLHVELATPVQPDQPSTSSPAPRPPSGPPEEATFERHESSSQAALMRAASSAATISLETAASSSSQPEAPAPLPRPELSGTTVSPLRRQLSKAPSARDLQPVPSAATEPPARDPTLGAFLGAEQELAERSASDESEANSDLESEGSEDVAGEQEMEGVEEELQGVARRLFLKSAEEAAGELDARSAGWHQAMAHASAWSACHTSNPLATAATLRVTQVLSLAVALLFLVSAAVCSLRLAAAAAPCAHSAFRFVDLDHAAPRHFSRGLQQLWVVSGGCPLEVEGSVIANSTEAGPHAVVLRLPEQASVTGFVIKSNGGYLPKRFRFEGADWSAGAGGEEGAVEWTECGAPWQVLRGPLQTPLGAPGQGEAAGRAMMLQYALGPAWPWAVQAAVPGVRAVCFLALALLGCMQAPDRTEGAWGGAHAALAALQVAVGAGLLQVGQKAAGAVALLSGAGALGLGLAVQGQGANKQLLALAMGFSAWMLLAEGMQGAVGGGGAWREGWEAWLHALPDAVVLALGAVAIGLRRKILADSELLVERDRQSYDALWLQLSGQPDCGAALLQLQLATQRLPPPLHPPRQFTRRSHRHTPDTSRRRASTSADTARSPRPRVSPASLPGPDRTQDHPATAASDSSAPPPGAGAGAEGEQPEAPTPSRLLRQLSKSGAGLQQAVTRTLFAKSSRQMDQDAAAADASRGLASEVDLDAPVVSLEQLFAQAAAMEPVLRRKAVLDPKTLQQIKWVSLKRPQRAIEKVLRSYSGHVDRLVDVCRQSIVFEDVSDVTECLRLMDRDPQVIVLRCKNRLDPGYDSRTSAGYRDVALNLRIVTPETVRHGCDTHVCEVQLILKAFAERKSDDGHKMYVRFRNIRAE